MYLLKGSVETKIYNRFKKLQRKRCSTPVATHAPKGKATKKVLCWTIVPEPHESEDLTVLVSKIKKEWQRSERIMEKFRS